MNQKPRQILMTIALPYANGQIHLGHLVEAIQGDIWHRWQNLAGNQCLFICGSDAHGTSIMLAAEKQGVSPEQLVTDIRQDHMRDLAAFYVDFDNFYTTHSPENQALSNQIYERLNANGDISTKTISQAYDPEANIFLADRFVRGECPSCHAQDQYGDNCEVCGTTYHADELINPQSAISGAAPIKKESLHYFFDLNSYNDILKEWISEETHVQPQVANKLNEWFNDGLREWDISRDAPYFGFEIPGTTDKFFYVWLDAPVGYMASLKNLCEQRKDVNFDDYWGANSQAELYHFIGKDIVYFHALFWPAMLHGAGFRLPSRIFVHGYLTINSTKMSKSRGTFITGKQYLEQCDPEFLRYYYAAKLNDQVEDIDLNLTDFATRVNSDLVGKYVNLASRCAGFITKKFNGELAAELHDADLLAEFVAKANAIAELYEGVHYSRVVREIMALADRANQYIDFYKPWALAKEEGNEALVQAICTQGLNLFKVLTTYLKPILPATATKVEDFLQCDPLNWSNLDKPLLSHTINKFKPLMQRIQPEAIEALTQNNEHEQKV